MRCNDCCNFNQENEKFISCNLTRACIKKNVPDVEAKCNFFNKDMSNEPICFNCKHFLGGGDWGLSCGKDYYRLVDALDLKCEKFEHKE